MEKKGTSEAFGEVQPQEQFSIMAGMSSGF